MNPQKNFSIIWRIKSLDLVSFKSEDVDPNNIIESDKINFKLGLEVNVQNDQKKVSIQCPVEIYSDEKHNHLIGSIHTKGEYIIENFSEIISSNNNQLPLGVIISLVGVTYSSTRGMLCLLSKGTIFEKAIIPIIDPSVFFKKENSLEKV
jgi:hypothetical protein